MKTPPWFVAMWFVAVGLLSFVAGVYVTGVVWDYFLVKHCGEDAIWVGNRVIVKGERSCVIIEGRGMYRIVKEGPL